MLYKTIYSRIFLIICLIGVTFFYAHYEKKKVEIFTEVTGEPILQSLPDLEVSKFDSKDATLSAEELIADDSRGLVVHFWGTWCAPCEAELPSFLELAANFEKVPVNFLLIAVNDEEKKIRKFLRRFKEIPKNVHFGIDNSGKSMEQLGTVKVPETYLFNPSKKHLRKFIGPQEWSRSTFITSIRDLLSI